LAQETPREGDVGGKSRRAGRFAWPAVSIHVTATPADTESVGLLVLPYSAGLCRPMCLQYFSAASQILQNSGAHEEPAFSLRPSNRVQINTLRHHRSLYEKVF
jgi:hypothetical protein